MLSHLKQPLSASRAYCIWDTVLFVCVASIVNSFVYQIFFSFFKMNVLATSRAYRNGVEERLWWIYWGSDGLDTGRALDYRVLDSREKVNPKWRSVGCQKTRTIWRRGHIRVCQKHFICSAQGRLVIHSFTAALLEGPLWPATVPSARSPKVARQVFPRLHRRGGGGHITQGWMTIAVIATSEKFRLSQENMH